MGMVECVVDLVADSLPGGSEGHSRVLDIGALLAPFGDRAHVVQSDVRACRLEESLDAAMSNLVLHNLLPEERQALLDSLRSETALLRRA